MIFQTVCSLLAQITGWEEGRMSMDTIILEDIEATLDDFHELIQALEVEYDLEWPDDAMDTMPTIGKLVHYIEENI